MRNESGGGFKFYCRNYYRSLQYHLRLYQYAQIPSHSHILTL